MNRTTVRLEPKLLKEAKQMAIEKDLSLQQIINWGLEILISNRKNNNQVIQNWPTTRLGKNVDDLILDKDFIYGTPRI